MSTSQRSAQARRELDRKFRETDLESIRARPHTGWVRAVRGALGMTQASLARRLGVTNAAVTQLERAEVNGGVTLSKLSDVARALDCSLVYALVPNTSLEDTVQRQALRVAKEQMGYIATTMALEDQAVAEARTSDALADQVRRIIERNEMWPAE
ncbi:MAG TPA: mobile mystery protein A [Acidimicrobiales bacterium]|nr:mobile mystery protein A [Acidimicrobiales bacterium]